MKVKMSDIRDLWRPGEYELTTELIRLTGKFREDDWPAAQMIFNEVDVFMHMQEMGRLLTFYRVQTRDNTVVVSEFGIGKMTETYKNYSCTSSVDELPEWMKRKLAVLVTIPFDKPTEELEGIGRRVSEHVYWVYPSENETLEIGEKGGTDTRAKGKARRKKTT